MANRPVFVAQKSARNVGESTVAFEWFPGFSVSQKQRSIYSLHEAARLELGLALGEILEVSTKAPSALGASLSALNLSLELDTGRLVPVEVAFQSSKVFRHAGPQTSLLDLELGRNAKAAIRGLDDDELIGFFFEGRPWPLSPSPNIYDYLYLRALSAHPELTTDLRGYRAFTDIEFNPKRSLNCQARSCAYFVLLGGRHVAENTTTPETFQVWGETLHPTTQSALF